MVIGVKKKMRMKNYLGGRNKNNANYQANNMERDFDY